MFEVWGFFLLGLVFLMLGGDSVVKGANGLAKHYGLSPFATGLVLVAFATSIPELVVNARAAFVGAQSLALGNAVKQVAARLDISISSVNTYRGRIFAKLQLRSNAELIRYALQHGLVE